MTKKDPPSTTMPDDAETRRRFAEAAAAVRPRLFRYCARMTGSVFDGEDIVQESLAKAFHALDGMTDLPPFEPWMFRIAHNTAMDFLKRYERKNVDIVADVPDSADAGDEGADDMLLEAALTVFVTLPTLQRSALVLKDVLGFSLAETAEIMGTTIASVKAALFRARANIEATNSAPSGPATEISVQERASLKRYADVFNARDWDALRSLLAEEAQLDLVSRLPKRSAAAAGYSTRYSTLIDEENLRAEPGYVSGVAAIAIFRPAFSATPAYYILLEWKDGLVANIRDFRYVPYIAEGARFSKMD
ncbi:MAG: sigma-70 family RNA polymerase sigma factor [Polyangiaceae bacterium]|nr:sigma-70 family RNA polymerase sigma factor [Polyangiaceae bacterium]